LTNTQYVPALQSHRALRLSLFREVAGLRRRSQAAETLDGRNPLRLRPWHFWRSAKLLEKPKAGKQKMRQFGKVEIPQDAFIAALKMDGD
jgi:hypothetical protein